VHHAFDVIFNYIKIIILHHVISYRVYKSKLKVKMQSVSDDDVWKRLVEKPRFELAAKGVFRLGRCYIFRQGVPGLRASNRESTATDG